MPLSAPIFVWLPALILAAAGLIYILITIRAHNRQREQVQELETRLDQTINRLNTVIQLNRALVEARDEKSLVEAALSSVNRLVNGLGVSFVPFDAWGQPLPAFTLGELPEPVLKGWAEHLVSEQTRSLCSQCKELHALDGRACP